MFQPKSFAAASALTLLFCGTAHAALTADQVWKSWKDGAGVAGLTITAATEANSGGVLTLNGVTIAPTGTTSGLTISDMTLTEESNGTVTIRPGASIGVDHAEGVNATKIALTHDGLTIVAREDAGAMVYDFSAAKADLAVDVAMEGYSLGDTPPGPATKTVGTIHFETLAGAYSDTPGANRAFGLDLSAAKLGYDFTSDDPSLKMKSATKSEAVDFGLGFDVTLPSTILLTAIKGPADFSKALEEGFAVAATFKQGSGSGTASQENEVFPYQMTMSSLPGSGSFVFNKDKFELASASEGMELAMTSAKIPAPVNAKVGAVAMTLLTPVVAATPADFALKLGLTQLTLNDEVWGLFDPKAALKREPLDLNIDISGKAAMDLLAMAAAEETGTVPPVPAPEKVDITDITLKVAGAALNATGAFTFNNASGVPMPLGEANVKVSGANALIDGLIASGIVSQDDAMGARMMMGMFMAPGAEPDSLTSKIEVKDGFAVFVNGQQIQ